MNEIRLNIYAIGVQIIAESPIIVNIGKDFEYFHDRDVNKTTDATIRLRAVKSKPPYERLKGLRASLYLPESISFDKEGVRYVDYQGKLLTVYNYRTEEGEIYSEDDQLMYEVVYLLIHSRVGELMDKKGKHRVHALGITVAEEGAVLLLPQGGGKTTLCLELLKNKSVKIISDDTPLINKKGYLFPFPLRIGIDQSHALDVPFEYIRTFNRRKYGIKKLIDIGYFSGQIAGTALCRFVFIGEREYSNNARIVNVGKIKAFSSLFKNCVIGLGLPQVVEYFLRNDRRDLAAKLMVVASRIAASIVVILRSKTLLFVMGLDSGKNAETLIRYISESNGKT